MFASPLARPDLPSLARTWREARPFPHVIIDDFVPTETLVALRRAISEEAHYRNQSELYDFMASSEPAQHPTLDAFRAALVAPESLAAVAEITGKSVSRVELRSYVYLPGMYSVPHTDLGQGRCVAYAFYLVAGDAITGGELEMFRCAMDGAEVVSTEPALTIRALDNRIVIFDVAPETLHQVREVLSGGRCSLAGWFFP